ncbi:MAG: transglycosylase SLT domain-containing protein [Acidobacteriota bacterium]
MRMNRYRLAAGCALVLLLAVAGCGPSQKPVAPKVQPQATAPATPEPLEQQAAKPATATASPQDAQIRQLIARVEQAYAAGDADYRKGRLPEAKTQFDEAVDLMLTSGIDIKSHPELQDEFDRIVDQVNALEMEALKVGNGFAPAQEETPAEVASDVTFKVDPNLVAKARNELATTHSDLPIMVNDYVAAFINFFANTQKGHNTLLHSFERAGRYKAMIQRVMAEEGVPQDLIYLAVAESGFQPRAVNRRSGAGGMWQFMPHGDYGLVRNGYLDERFDPEKSTRSYARYMKYLYDQLGDWYLAMAAYDWGAGNVQRAVQKTGYADFWELYKRNNLPGETKNYVPEILAAIIIANHPKQYGFDEVTLDPPVITDTVTINYSVDLRLVSDIVGVPVDELQALNPSLLRMTTPPDSPFDLHLPAGTGAIYQQQIADIPESHRTAWRYHRLSSGDTLASVAHEFHVSAAELAAANQIDEGDSLSGVKALVIPVAAAPSRSLFYVARRGDTLVSIADRFGVSLQQLRRWNHLTGTRVAPGRRLHVTEPAAVHRTTKRRAHSLSTSRTSGHAKHSAASSKTKKTAQKKSRKSSATSSKRTATHTAASSNR